MCRGIRDFSFEKSEPSLVSVVRGAWVAGLLFCGFEKKRLVRVKLLVVLPVLRCYRRRGREHRAPLQGLTRRWRRVSNCYGYNTAYGALRVSLVHGPSSAQRIALFLVARSLLAPLSVRPWLALFRDPAALLASLQPAALFASLPPLATTQTPGLPPQGLFRTTRIYPLRHQNSSGQAPPKAREKNGATAISPRPVSRSSWFRYGRGHQGSKGANRFCTQATRKRRAVRDASREEQTQYLKRWDVLTSTAVLYTAVLTPFEVAFLASISGPAAWLDPWFLWPTASWMRSF